MKEVVKQKIFRLFKFSFLFNFIKIKLLPDNIIKKYISSQNKINKILEGILKNQSRYNPTDLQILKSIVFQNNDHKIKLFLDLNEYTQCGYYFNVPNNTLKNMIVDGGDTFIDIGANVGIFSLMAIHYFKKVFSFEPMPKTFEILNNNINLTSSINNNLLNKIKTFNFAVSNSSYNTKLYKNPLNLGGSKLTSFSNEYKSNSGINEGWDEFDTSCITLDEFVENNKIKNISLIKIDVEGHEVEVLEGAKMVLIKHSPVIYIEISTDRNFEKILSLLPENYSIWNPATNNISETYDNVDFVLANANPFI